MIFLDFVALWITVYFLVDRLNVVPSVWERLALAFAFALGLKSLVLFALMALGLPLDIFIQTAVSCTALVLVALIRWKQSHRMTVSIPPSKSSLNISVICVLGVLLLLSLGNAGFFPITEADGIWYHVRGILFAHEAKFDSATMNAQFRQYPPFVPLVFAYSISFGHEKIKLIFPLLYLCLLALFYFRVMEETKNSKVAGAFALVLGTTPYFWWHSALPFLDLTAGFYYSVGSLYWFFLIQRILTQDHPALNAESRSLAIISGTFFGIAAWTRLEFLLYNAIPLLLLIAALHRNTAIPKKERNKVLLSFAVPLLFFSSLWFLTLVTFDSALERRVLAVACVCVGLWFVVLASLKWHFKLTNKRWVVIGGLGAGFYLVLMIVAGPQSVSLGKALLIALTRSLSVHAFYAMTAVLIFFLFWQDLKKLPETKKLLGVFLILYPLAHFAIFSYSEPKWPHLAAYVDAVVIHPGHSINLSDTRAMLAFYPLLVFFIAGLPLVQNGFAVTNRPWIAKSVYGIIAGNLVVLSIVFIFPRVQFFLSHSNLTHVQLSETRGSGDMPNQFSKTYAVANRLRQLTPEDATLFMPPGDRQEGSFRSAVIQVLYPRRIVFGDDVGFENKLNASQVKPTYTVFSAEWHPEFCGERPRIPLNDSGFGMCRLDS